MARGTIQHNDTNGEESPTTAVKENVKPIVSVKREDLWVDALECTVDGGVIQMTGIGSGDHTVFAHVNEGTALSVSQVVQAVVDEGRKHAAAAILERKLKAESHPSASELFHLGAVWLLNEAAYAEHHNADAKRLSLEDIDLVPDWKDITLRVHYSPDRFYAADTVDWTKYCRGLLVGNKVEVKIGDEVPHVPVLEGMPDAKDGVIVYEDDKLGFAIVNKPGNMPIHATLSNHNEDVVSRFHEALVERKMHHSAHVSKTHVSVLPRFSVSISTEASGLLALSTRTEFTNYLSRIVDRKEEDTLAFTKKFKCLVCIKDPDIMDTLEKYQLNQTIITHYTDPASPVPKHFVRQKPNQHAGKNWLPCHFRITKVGDENFRAACVSTVYKDSVDACLAHRLWDPSTPAESLSIQYVMELEVEIVGPVRKDQIRGQLAALGCPVVGDMAYGGGKCDVHANRHTWNRMALQCCEISFMEPRWEEIEGNHHKQLEATDRKCVFRLHEAWWTEYLEYYEMLVVRTAAKNLE